VDYTNDGGIVIFGIAFSSFVLPDHLARFFKDKWALNWELSPSHRYMFAINPRTRDNPLFTDERHLGLLDEYSMRVVFLSGPKPEDFIYVAGPDRAQGPAVFVKYGNGFLGWIGDINQEIGTTQLLLTMCGV
jgi:hypothetical protein